jgi:peroxin-10
MRTAVILASLIPSYVMGRWGHSSALNNSHPTLAKWFIIIPTAMDIATEVNLAVFYLRGSYYDLIKRLIGVQHVSLPSPPPLHLNLTVPRYLLSQKTLIHDLHHIHCLEF